MGRWAVILLAVVATMGILFFLFPTLREETLNVGQYSIRWAIITALGAMFACHKLTN